MKFLRSHWFIVLLGALIILIFVCELLLNAARKKKLPKPEVKTAESLIPDIRSLTNSEEDNLIRYGKELIVNTSKYLGPAGIVSHISNGMNCGNCHMEAGTKLYTNNFLAAASTYPKFRERSGRVESIEFRINECMERSLCGKRMDSMDKEMRAMVAYIKWVGKNVSKNEKVEFIELSTV